MSVERYVVRLRGLAGALVGRLADGTPADEWHVAFVAWPDTAARHAASLAAKVPGAVVDLLAPETDVWNVPALEPAAWRRWEEQVREARKRARGAEDPPVRRKKNAPH